MTSRSSLEREITEGPNSEELVMTGEEKGLEIVKRLRKLEGENKVTAKEEKAILELKTAIGTIRVFDGKTISNPMAPTSEQRRLWDEFRSGKGEVWEVAVKKLGDVEIIGSSEVTPSSSVTPVAEAAPAEAPIEDVVASVAEAAPSSAVNEAGIYEDFNKDPLITEIEGKINLAVNADPEILALSRAKKKKVGTDKWREVFDREARIHWDSFVRENPEKAQAYGTQGHEEIKEALERLKGLVVANTVLPEAVPAPEEKPAPLAREATPAPIETETDNEVEANAEKIEAVEKAIQDINGLLTVIKKTDARYDYLKSNQLSFQRIADHLKGSSLVVPSRTDEERWEELVAGEGRVYKMIKNVPFPKPEEKVGEKEKKDAPTAPIAEVDPETEKKRIYENYYDDPVILQIENEITEATLSDSQVIEADKNRTESKGGNYGQIWQQVFARENLARWKKFIAEYPEKAAAYAEKSDDIRKALRTPENLPVPEEPKVPLHIAEIAEVKIPAVPPTPKMPEVVFDSFKTDEEVAALEKEIIRATNDDEEVGNARAQFGKDGFKYADYSKVWESVNNRISAEKWAQFAEANPEKAQAYGAQGHPQLEAIFGKTPSPEEAEKENVAPLPDFSPKVLKRMEAIGLTPEILAAFPEFRDIAASEGKVAWTLDKMTQFKLTRDRHEAIEDHDKHVREAGNLWDKFKRSRASQKDKREVEYKKRGLDVEEHKDDIAKLIHLAQIGPDFILTKDEKTGKETFVGQYLENLPGHEKEQLDFNRAATAFANLPTERDREKEKDKVKIKQWEAIENEYKKRTKEIVGLLPRNFIALDPAHQNRKDIKVGEQGDTGAMLQMENLDFKVKMNQTLNQYPDAEIELKKLTESETWKGKFSNNLKGFAKDALAPLSFGAMMGARAGAKYGGVLSGLTGPFGATIAVGAIFGAWRGHSNANKTLLKEEEQMKMGLGEKTRSSFKLNALHEERAKIVMQIAEAGDNPKEKGKLEKKLEKIKKSILKSNTDDNFINLESEYDAQGNRTKKGTLAKIEDLAKLVGTDEEDEKYAYQEYLKTRAGKKDPSQEAFNVKRREWAEMLEVRLEYTARKLKEGKINFGKEGQALGNRFELIQTVAAAYTKLASQSVLEDREPLARTVAIKKGGEYTGKAVTQIRRNRLASVLELAENRIIKNRDIYKSEERAKGMIKGVLFGAAGFGIGFEASQLYHYAAEHLGFHMAQTVADKAHDIAGEHGHVAGRNFKDALADGTKKHIQHIKVRELVNETSPSASTGPIESPKIVGPKEDFDSDSSYAKFQNQLRAEVNYPPAPFATDYNAAPEVHSAAPTSSIPTPSAAPTLESVAAATSAPSTPEASPENLGTKYVLQKDSDSVELIEKRHLIARDNIGKIPAGRDANIQMHNVLDTNKGEEAMPFVRRGDEVYIKDFSGGHQQITVVRNGEVLYQKSDLPEGSTPVENTPEASNDSSSDSSSTETSDAPENAETAEDTEAAPTEIITNPNTPSAENIQTVADALKEHSEVLGYKESDGTLDEWANNNAVEIFRTHPGFNKAIEKNELFSLTRTPTGGWHVSPETSVIPQSAPQASVPEATPTPTPSPEATAPDVVPTPQEVLTSLSHYEVSEPTSIPEVALKVFEQDPSFRDLATEEKDRALFHFITKYYISKIEDLGFYQDLGISPDQDILDLKSGTLNLAGHFTEDDGDPMAESVSWAKNSTLDVKGLIDHLKDVVTTVRESADASDRNEASIITALYALRK